MKGLQVRNDSRRIARSMAAAAKTHRFTRARKTDQTQVWSAGGSPMGGPEAEAPKLLQEILWKQFFADSAQWWDNRRSKPSPLHPDFRHKESKVPLWLNNRHKPVWVDSQLVRMDAGLTTTPETGFATVPPRESYAANKGSLELGMCRKLCEDGVLSDAVDALDLLVQRECHVPSTFFYRTLKRCIQNKDLPLGRRIHALTVQSGYEGDAFLATHLINLYSRLGRLEEALGVFTKVSVPDAYNWATIILAYAKHGEAAEAARAIRLYRQMCESSNVEPDNRLYSAVLKACAVAKDVTTGKEVHARIAADPRSSDKFVQAGIVIMYSKCGCLEDARSLFDKLPDRNIETFTSIIAAYTQQSRFQEALDLYSTMQQEGLTPDFVTYSCLLQACASVGVGALKVGEHLYAEIKQRGLQENAVLGGSLVDMYTKCGSIKDARSLFDELKGKNVVIWTAMIAGYAQQEMGKEALSLYRIMQLEGLTAPNAVTYVCVLRACANVGAGALNEGKQLHVQIKEQGLDGDVVVGRGLVNMYAKCGSLEDARRVFDRLAEKNIVAWNTMITGYAQQKMGKEALSLYCKMQQEGVSPNSVTYVSLLQACASVGVSALQHGKQLHLKIQEEDVEVDAVLGGSLVNMYVKCGSLKDGRRLFDKLPDRSVLAWNAMIAGYAQHRVGHEALSLYGTMQLEGLTPSPVTYLCLLQACANTGASALDQGKQLHAEIKERCLEKDAVLGGGLVNMYAKCGSLEVARTLFDMLAHRNVVAWNAMITGYVQHGMGQEALSLYHSMLQDGLTPDYVTYTCLLQACASVGVDALQQGKRLHAQIGEQGLEEDAIVGGSLVNMYAKCGSLEDARNVFDKLKVRNVVAWNSMFAGYTQQGMAEEVLTLYSRMREEEITPDFVTYVCLLQTCASVGIAALREGKLLHEQIKKRGLVKDGVLGRSLVNMYAKCGKLEDARRLFEELPDRNVVAWNAMISGYAQQGMSQEALSLYGSMQQEGLIPDSVTYVCLLQACAAVAALPLGVQLHAEIEKSGMYSNDTVGVALVNMYAKCGSVSESQSVFDALSARSIEAWNALLTGYARQGDSQVVFDLLAKMRLEGIRPDEITYLSVLTVCSHVGLVDKGREYFEAMRTDHGVKATMEHYICMVDLLGRAGYLQEALEMTKNMPFPPNLVVWYTLLGACRKWKNVEIGRQAFKGAVSVDDKDAAAYVLMSNIYASTRMWEAAKEMKARRVKSGAWKKPGESWWTDVEGVVHTFRVGDKKHPESESIYRRLQKLIPKLRKEGYVPHLESSLQDVADEKKEAELCGHSEKLAIAYALNKTSEGTTIRIVKNLRVCEDCHEATAYISKVEKRTIICRDASRFHVFKEGHCSCGNYW